MSDYSCSAAAPWIWREQSAVTLVNNENQISDINALLLGLSMTVGFCYTINSLQYSFAPILFLSTLSLFLSFAPILFLSTLSLGPVREVRFLIPGEDSRPADVLLPHWIAGQDAAMDVTVVNPCQVATVVGAATTAGHALQHAYTRKMRGAADACQQQGVTFLPMVVESFGGWHEGSVREVERLGAALARQTGQEEEEAVRHLWGKLGMLLQRGNAAILANRVPSFPAPAIDGRH